MSAGALQARGLRIAGIMTGTSCDGLDLACVEFNGSADRLRWRSLWSASAPYPPALRRRVLAAQLPDADLALADWLVLNRDLGRWYGQAIARLVRKRAPHVLANHGQTLAHHPSRGVTLQLGDPSILARETGITVACSFREGDLAAGGQGAPLVPRFHSLLAREIASRGQAISIHNLGGISNLTYLGRGAPLAFDTGPANLWIDAAAARATNGHLRMDRGGRLARLGRVDDEAVRRALAHPFFRKSAPKSTGRDEFPFELLTKHTGAKGADLVATATAVTVESIARAYENAILRRGLPLHTIHFGGGGAKNPTLLEWLAARLPSIRIATLEDSGHDSQLVEAQAFAYSGCLALLGHPVGGAWTGASGFAPPAHLIPGANWRRVVARVRETQSRR